MPGWKELQLYSWSLESVAQLVLSQINSEGAVRIQLHGSHNFQWTIAWFLGYDFSLSSVHTRSACVNLLVQQKCPTIYEEPWFRVITMVSTELCSSCDVPDFGYKWLMLWSANENKVMILQIPCKLSETIIYFCCQQLGDWLRPCSTQRVFLSGSGKFQREAVALLDIALIECKPWIYGVYFWANYLNASACGSGVLFLCLQFEIQNSLGSPEEFCLSRRLGNLPDLLVMVELKPWPSWELFSCSFVLSSHLYDALHNLTSSILTLKGIYSKSSHYPEVRILDENSILFSTSKILYVGELYWLLRQYSSCNQFLTEGAAYFVFKGFEWQILSCFCSRHAISPSNWLPMKLVGSHWTFKSAFLLRWKVTSTIASVTSMKNNSGTVSHALQHLEVGKSFAATILLLNSPLSDDWSVYIPVASIIQCECMLMAPLKNASSEACILTYLKEVLISWDAGGLAPDPDTSTGNWNHTQLSFLQLTWDPGGPSWIYKTSA